VKQNMNLRKAVSFGIALILFVGPGFGTSGSCHAARSVSKESITNLKIIQQLSSEARKAKVKSEAMQDIAAAGQEALEKTINSALALSSSGCDQMENTSCSTDLASAAAVKTRLFAEDASSAAIDYPDDADIQEIASLSAEASLLVQDAYSEVIQTSLISGSDLKKRESAAAAMNRSLVKLQTAVDKAELVFRIAKSQRETAERNEMLAENQ